MAQLNDKLNKYRIDKLDINEDHVAETLKKSKEIFYHSQELKSISFIEFLRIQMMYIKKIYWLMQFIILFGYWLIIYMVGNSEQLERNMGIMSCMFVILMVPEFWKNISNKTVELENTAYYSIRQIYSARMLLFGMADTLILTAFCGMVSLTTMITVEQIIIQFFLPLNVNCCICCRILRNRKYDSEYFAILASIVWSVLWSSIVMNDAIYKVISKPVWAVCIVLTVIYFTYSVVMLFRDSRRIYELN